MARKSSLSNIEILILITVGFTIWIFTGLIDMIGAWGIVALTILIITSVIIYQVQQKKRKKEF